jgi:predicted metal-dependent hydrolase
MTADYRVLVSDRAKTPRLKLSVRDGLVVVVPRGFDRTRVPGVVEGKRDWIRRNGDRLAEQAKYFVSQPPARLPERIALRAIGEDWSVCYRPSNASGVTAVERRGRQLLVYGALDDQPAVIDALGRWLSRKTRDRLVPWLRRLGGDRGLAVTDVAVRSQRKRWASLRERHDQSQLAAHLPAGGARPLRLAT